MDTRKYLAELVGTFLFLTIGYASVAAAAAAGVSTLLVVPFAFPLGLLAAIFAVGHISGGPFQSRGHGRRGARQAHRHDRRDRLHPGAGHRRHRRCGGRLRRRGPGGGRGGDHASPDGNVTDVGALILEIILTAGFILVILVSTKRAPGLAPLAIPLTLVAIHFAAASLSGASVNPARSIGSALLGGDLNGLWIYIVAPIIGAVGGWALFRLLDEDAVEEVAA